MSHIVKTGESFFDSKNEHRIDSVLSVAAQFVCGFYLYKLSGFLPLSSAFGFVTGKSYGFLFSSLGGLYASEKGKG